MSRALVVYESMWGNSEQVARAVAAGVREVMEVELVEVASAPTDLADTDLVVAGGPTHAFSMSRANTRRDARGQGAPLGSVASGLREWLDALPREQGRWLAAFDTRVTKVRHLPGSAARSAARAGRHHGFTAAVHPESFYVLDVDGPLAEGELDRARQWGHAVAASLPAHV
jgi:Flavodoxin domain